VTANASGRKRVVTPKMAAANRRNARGPRLGRTDRKLDETDQRQLQRLYARLRAELPYCVDLARRMIRNRLWDVVEVEVKDDKTGEVHIDRQKRRVNVPLEMRKALLNDFMDRGGLPRRTEQDVSLVGEGAAVLLRVDGGLGWPEPLAPGEPATKGGGDAPAAVAGNGAAGPNGVAH
jgi:hypothetical protein